MEIIREVIVFDYYNSASTRKQARRILSDYRRFDKLVINFRDVVIVSKNFIDELFGASNIELIYKNANDKVIEYIKESQKCNI